MEAQAVDLASCAALAVEQNSARGPVRPTGARDARGQPSLSLSSAGDVDETKQHSGLGVSVNSEIGK